MTCEHDTARDARCPLCLSDAIGEAQEVFSKNATVLNSKSLRFVMQNGRRVLQVREWDEGKKAYRWVQVPLVLEGEK